MTPVRILTAAINAPGLPDWATARGVFGQLESLEPATLPFSKTGLLPPNEERRTTGTIQLALRVARQALEETDQRPEDLATVFASSCGDAEVVLRICRSLALQGRPVSPIQFHNSVHNAAAGYWHIAWGSIAPSVSLAAYDGTFAAGLLEAVTQVLTEDRIVLLVAYDLPPPPPIREVRPIRDPYGMALVLAPEGIHEHTDWGTLSLSLVSEEPETGFEASELESIRLGNPAARSLPLLQLLALGGSDRVVLPYTSRSGLAVELNAP